MNEWVVPVSVVVSTILTVGTWGWYLSSRLTAAEAKTTAAETLAAGASARAIATERALAEHKEHVAAEYVSRDALREVTGAINRLGDRLDKLFEHLIDRAAK